VLADAKVSQVVRWRNRQAMIVALGTVKTPSGRDVQVAVIAFPYGKGQRTVFLTELEAAS